MLDVGIIQNITPKIAPIMRKKMVWMVQSGYKTMLLKQILISESGVHGVPIIVSGGLVCELIRYYNKSTSRKTDVIKEDWKQFTEACVCVCVCVWVLCRIKLENRMDKSHINMYWHLKH